MDMVLHSSRLHRFAKHTAAMACVVVPLIAPSGGAAIAQNTWSTATQAPAATSSVGGATAAPAPRQAAILTFEAYLTAEVEISSQRPISQGLVWRIYAPAAQGQAPKLISHLNEAIPTVQLAAGQYIVNAAFGRAHLTRVINVVAGARRREQFVLNAGGLKVITKVSGNATIERGKARYDIYSDERDQFGKRRRVISNAKPGLITRLNSGIYQIVSRLGDANAHVSAEVAVEAGKLTEAVVSHEAAKVTFKLVQTQSGEALADTQWIIMTNAGSVVKETAGALPTHVLAPGSYSVSARWRGKLFTRTFDITSGKNIEIEVLMR